MKKSTLAIIIVAAIAACGLGGWRYHEAQITKMQDAGVESLKAVVSLSDYRDEEQAEIGKIIDAGEVSIRECREQEAIDSIIDKSKASISEFKTDAELTAEEEEAARLAELERQRKEEEERQAALAAQQAAAKSRKKSSSGGSKNGCVGGGSDVFN